MVVLADLPQLPAQPMLIAAVTAFLASVFVIYKLVGAAVKLFFFVAAFGVGYGIAYLLGEFGGHPQAQWVYAGEGLAFAWVLNLIRAKIARAIVGAAVLALGQISGWFGFAPKTATPDKPEKPPVHAKKHHSTTE